MIHKNANPHYLAHKFSYLEPKYAGPSRKKRNDKNGMRKTSCRIRIYPSGVCRSFFEAFIEAFMNGHLLPKNQKRRTTVGTAQWECISTEQSQLSSDLSIRGMKKLFSYNSHNQEFVFLLFSTIVIIVFNVFIIFNYCNYCFQMVPMDNSFFRQLNNLFYSLAT